MNTFPCTTDHVWIYPPQVTGCERDGKGNGTVILKWECDACGHTDLWSAIFRGNVLVRMNTPGLEPA